MEQINNILVTLSFEAKEQAEINHALTLAKLYGSKIMLFSVIPELSSDEQLQISAMSPEERINNMVSQRKQQLEELNKSLSDEGCDTSHAVVVGTPSTEIVKQATENNHDLVIIGTRVRKSLKEKLFGSTSNAVLRKCPTPVLAIKPDHSGKYSRIMASLDISQDPTIINNKVLSEAESLAKADNSELHALTIISAKMPDQDGNNPRDNAKKELTQLISSQEVVVADYNTHIGVGDAAIVMSEEVEKHDIDLLVMGMASRTGIMGFFVGNLAEKVMASVDCSILTVKPDGFKG